MKRCLHRLLAFIFLPLLLAILYPASQAYAAEFRTGEQVYLTDPNQTLTDPYIFGGTIQLDSPVSNELTVAGGDIVITSPVEGSALIAGGNITVRGPIGNNARIAGGNITIDGPIANDLVITGGSVTLTQNASVGGDLLFAGGQLRANGPIAGDANINGGELVLNNTVGGSVHGDVGTFALGSAAVINGNLSYKSPERAQIAQGASVKGKTNFQQTNDDKQNEGQEFLTTVALYKLLADILICLLLIYFFRPTLTNLLQRMSSSPVRSGAIGFGFFFLVPVAALILMVLLWLGITTFLFYFLTFIVAMFIAQLFLGWMIMRWWYRNQKVAYTVDWKAAIVGPLALLILNLIPVLGWLAAGVIFMIALGSIVQQLAHQASTQRAHHPPTPAKRSK